MHAAHIAVTEKGIGACGHIIDLWLLTRVESLHLHALNWLHVRGRMFPLR